MNDTKKPTMWRIAKTTCFGWEREGEYATREEAQSMLDEMKACADKQDAEREAWLAAHPKPWSNHDKFHASIVGYDSAKTFAEKFAEAGWHLKEVPASPSVYRLNTLPADSAALMREIEAKVALFGECSLGWSCHGHTRAEWQSAAAAAQIKAAHSEWRVVNRGHDVYIYAAPAK